MIVLSIKLANQDKSNWSQIVNYRLWSSWDVTTSEVSLQNDIQLYSWLVVVLIQKKLID